MIRCKQTVLLLIVCTLLAGCPWIKKPTACHQLYSESFYISACNADLVLLATQREIDRRRAIGYDTNELDAWQAKVDSAWRRLDEAEAAYRTDGVSLLEPNSILDRALDELDKWAKGQTNG